MARINLGILGGFNGKVGTVVGYGIYGKRFMRAYTDRVNDARTEKQLNNRLRFKTLSKIGSSMTKALNMGLQRASDGHRHNTFNCFMHHPSNLEAVSVSNGTATVDYTKIAVSKGKLADVMFNSADFDDAQHVKVTFSPNSDTPGASADDKVYMVVYQPDLNQSILSAAVLRSAGSIDMRMPISWSGLKVHAYGFVVGMDEKAKIESSNSNYLGFGTIG